MTNKQIIDGGTRKDAVVPSALAALSSLDQTIRKTDLPYNNVPVELLIGPKLDLSVWSLVLTDTCLRALNSNATRLVAVNLSGAEKITDVGLQWISDCTSALVALNLDNSYLVTSRGLEIITKCHKLQHLSLSGCMGIDGEGFGIIGQNCRSLITLKLSGCRQIKHWSFTMIFGNCKQLQSLDISFCTLVTDEAMKVLADGAPNLKQLNLRDCKLISDIGLSYISQGCPSLSELNLRRSDMPFRVTDVALLQLGQACKSLVSINLHGCEMITDTGLSWLSGWSKELRHIDLSNCSRVTNVGIRHLGEGKYHYTAFNIFEFRSSHLIILSGFIPGCKQLRSIVLLNLKKVSDVGVRYLANGCHYLEALNGSGLSLLTDGADRSGLEGLPALGKSHCSVTLRHLNFHGCNMLSTLSMKAIAKFPNIVTLDLSGCNQLTLEGAKCVGKACTCISVLSLSCCGDCISNSIVEVLVARLDLLSSVNLSFCPKVGDKSLRALAACKRLESLDLTGCVHVTDQSVFHLCNGSFNPGLRHLFLAQCCHVGDTSLSWIAQGLKQKESDCCVTLETLSLTGTRVTLPGIESIRDRLPYSSIRSNASFQGFWPLDRLADRKQIKQYHKRAHSAAIIQALARSRREKDTLKQAREEYCKKRVAVRISALFRGRKARRYCRELKKAKKERLRSTKMIQCAYRCHLARKRVRRKREIKWLTVAPLASTVIQKQWRGVLGRREAIQKRMEACQHCQRQIEATIVIESWFRMLQAKRLKLQLLCQTLTRELHRFRAALRIQCAWRITTAVKNVRRLKEEERKHTELQSTATHRIAAAFRSTLFRRAINHRVEWTRKRKECTLVIQRFYRDQLQRIMRNKMAKQQQAERRLRASVLIQTHVRKWLAHLQLLTLQQQRDRIIAVETDSATIISRWARVCVAKFRLSRRRVEFDEEIRQRIVLKIRASTTIAAGWRGKLGRDRAKAVRTNRAQRWKALFCEKQQVPYYYNQDTGETRWEKPHCLLELEPKPVCSNCEGFLAEIECAECDEFFCTACFEFIHHGGKRQLHTFRTVYDYYGRRKDYNRDEFKTKDQQGTDG